MGSVNGSCHPDSGVCSCKGLVAGDKCDGCQAGATHFDPKNHFGCSKGGQIPIFTSCLLPFPAIMLNCILTSCIVFGFSVQHPPSNQHQWVLLLVILLSNFPGIHPTPQTQTGSATLSSEMHIQCIIYKVVILLVSIKRYFKLFIIFFLLRSCLFRSCNFVCKRFYLFHLS